MRLLTSAFPALMVFSSRPDGSGLFLPLRTESRQPSASPADTLCDTSGITGNEAVTAASPPPYSEYWKPVPENPFAKKRPGFRIPPLPILV